jgi:hypothetical protein
MNEVVVRLTYTWKLKKIRKERGNTFEKNEEISR